MTDQDKQAFQIAMAAMAEVYRVDVSESLLRTYWLIFQEYQLDAFNQAAQQAVMKLKWFPKPAELIELMNGDEDAAADDAWLVLNKAIDEHGSYRSVIFSDGFLNRTVESFGWRTLCECDTESFDKFTRPQFVSVYKMNRRNKITTTGINRGHHGIEDKNVVRIGAEDRTPKLSVVTGDQEIVDLINTTTENVRA